MGYTRRDILATGVIASAGSLLASIPLAGSVNNKPNKSCENAADLRPIQPTWNSLRTVNTPPQWLRDGKFGIYTHWGVYSVPAFGNNGTWYAHNMYTKPDSDERKHQEATYGPLDKFGYKDFIPMFTGKELRS